MSACTSRKRKRSRTGCSRRACRFPGSHPDRTASSLSCDKSRRWPTASWPSGAAEYGPRRSAAISWTCTSLCAVSASGYARAAVLPQLRSIRCLRATLPTRWPPQPGAVASRRAKGARSGQRSATTYFPSKPEPREACRCYRCGITLKGRYGKPRPAGSLHRYKL